MSSRRSFHRRCSDWSAGGNASAGDGGDGGGVGSDTISQSPSQPSSVASSKLPSLRWCCIHATRRSAASTSASACSPPPPRTSASTSASARRGWALGPLAGAAGRLSDRGGAALLCWKLTMMGGSLSARVC